MRHIGRIFFYLTGAIEKARQLWGSVEKRWRKILQVSNTMQNKSNNLSKIIDQASLTAGAYLAAAFDEDSGEDGLSLLASHDGLTFEPLPKNPVYREPVTGLRDPSILYNADKWWVAHTNRSAPYYRFTILSSPDLLNWTRLSVLDARQMGVPGAVNAWAPEWFVDKDGSVHLFVAVRRGEVHRIYETHACNAALTEWSGLVEVTGTGFPTTMIDPFVFKLDGLYYFFYKNDHRSKFYIEYATSTHLTRGYVAQGQDDWAGWGKMEGHSLLRVDATTWRVYFNPTLTNGIRYSESADGFATWSAPRTLPSLAGYSHATILHL